MLAPRSHSTYAWNAFAIILGAATAVLIFCIILIMVLLCLAPRLEKHARKIVILLAILITLSEMLLTLDFAILSGFGYISEVAAFLLSSFMWLPSIMICMSLTGSAWRSTLLIAKSSFRGEGEQRRCCITLVSLGRAAYIAAVKKAGVFVVTSMFAFTFTLALVLSTAGMCYCTNPEELTSWASRRSDPHYCTPGKFCHLYSLVGQTSSELRLVGHITVADHNAATPLSTYASVCQLVSTSAGTRVCGASWQVAGSIVPHAQITEDLRYLSHIHLPNLTGETAYHVTVTFAFPGNVEVSSDISFRTLPGEQSDTPVHFLAGGDAYQGKKFLEMLMIGMLNVPSPHFFLFGGDLSYANNIRTCYLRWDQFLHALVSMKTKEGFSIHFLFIPGNHESGGYLTETDPGMYFFYPQYFPHQDPEYVGDLTITYHSHVFGKRLGIIGLDTNLIQPLQSQTSYLRQKLTQMQGATLSDAKFVIVFHHNPAFPSRRSLSDKNTVPVRELLLPIYDEFKVPLVLEFHDHTYKRTKPIFQRKVRPHDGTVFVGDGALGVYLPGLPPDIGREYLATAAGQNYINNIIAFPNGTVALASRSAMFSVIDYVVLTRR